MNNLNKDSQIFQKDVPDILRNLNITQGDEKQDYEKQNIHKAIEKKMLNSDCKPDLISDERVKSRKLKKALGYAGWVLCFPLMMAALALRDKPSKEDPEEWKDDPCLPWWYDVNFKYPGEDDNEEE